MRRLKIPIDVRPAARPRRPAFTLVELLVVIGIVAVLIAILLPVLRKAQEQARQAVCASNQRQICMAALQYANQNQGWLPRIDDPYLNFNQPSQGVIQFQPPRAWIDFTRGELMPYVGKDPAIRQRVFGCPSDPDPKVFVNLMTGAPALRNFSFSLNKGLAFPSPRVRWGCVRLTQIRGAEHKIIVVEMDSPGGIVADINYMTFSQGTTSIVPLLTARHSGFCNEAFFDGHVELIDPKIFNGTNDNTSVGLVNAASEHYMDLFADQ